MKKILGWLSFGFMLLAGYMAFLYAPTEKTMGNVQRIFYFHVPMAWVALLAFFLVFVYSILYLWKNNPFFDLAAKSAAGLGVLFTALVLVTGSVWARLAWGTWWTWDPRLTTTLILWLVYLSYFLLRKAAPGPQGARFAAVLGIVGFINVPLLFLAIRWWRTVHPVVFTTRGAGLEPRMLQTLLVSLAAFTLLFFYLLARKVSIESNKQGEID